MAKRSEDVLLQMGAVRYKKGDGTLYVMNERIAWMAENRNKVTVSHHFEEIKVQKISPVGKPKVQLQLVLNNDSSTVFHFINPNGIKAQTDDRDKVKDLLQPLLQKFKPLPDPELEEKKRILTEYPHVYAMYSNLVCCNVLTSEEFWSTHAKPYIKNHDDQKQDIGVSAAFLADIKPTTDGANGLKYNLTADIIQCIFKTYPAVKRKHLEYVPNKMKENDFWTKFFQSHYFHRDRLLAGNKDIFTECGKLDDKAMTEAINKTTGDVLLDLRSFEDNSLEEGFGGAASNKNGVNSGNIIHQNMVKRFNQHSMMVLNTCQKNNEQNTNGSCQSSDKSNQDMVDASNDNEPEKKRARIMEKIRYDDLVTDGTSESVVNENAVIATPATSELNLLKIEPYLHGPVPDTHTTDGNENLNTIEVTREQILKASEIWGTRTPQKLLINPKSAVNVLGELTPGGALMRGFQEQSLSQLVPPSIEKELRNLYLALSELMRHFWHSFPPSTPELRAEVIRMHDAIQRFAALKLLPFEEKVKREASPIGTSITQHLNRLIRKASQKFNTWKERKNRLNK